MASYDFSSLCALVVDDYRFMRMLLSEVLREFGFREVLSADDGSTAVDLLRTNAVDVVFLDWNMPKLDGIAFTEGVRSGAYGNDPYLPILMVSGFTEKSRVHKALDAGVHSYVLKPITPSSLGARLSQLIERPPHFIKTESYFGPYRRTRMPARDDPWENSG
jgi:CheY-like chemotaxis protein